MQGNDIIQLKNVTIDYELKQHTIRAVCDVTLPIVRGKITALVGESGSGKTTLASSIMQCISQPGRQVAGQVLFFNSDDTTTVVNELDHNSINQFRWKRVSMVFQAAQSALNPVMTVRQQFYETIDAHSQHTSREDKESRCLELLNYVKLDAERVIDCYPHQLSGGMKQRVMIAFALILDPDLIILDEPTTALDVITQSYIFSLLKKINQEKGISMLLLTHDISVVAKFADYVAVMYGARLMEYGLVRDVFKLRRHPYTLGLIGATPSIIGDIQDMKPIEGAPPDLLNMPQGCVFSPRCSMCQEQCLKQEPSSIVYPDGSIGKCYSFGGRVKQ